MSPDRYTPRGLLRYVRFGGDGTRQVNLNAAPDVNSPTANAGRIAEQPHYFPPLSEDEIKRESINFAGLVQTQGLLRLVNAPLPVEARATNLALASVQSQENKAKKKDALAVSSFNRTRDIFGQLLIPSTPFAICQGDGTWAISTTGMNADKAQLEPEGPTTWTLHMQRVRYSDEPQEDCYLPFRILNLGKSRADSRPYVAVGHDEVRDFFFADGSYGTKKLYPTPGDEDSIEEWASSLGSNYSGRDLLPSLGNADTFLGTYIDYGVNSYVTEVRQRLNKFVRRTFPKNVNEASSFLNLLVPLYETRDLGYRAGVDCVAETVIEVGQEASYYGANDYLKNMIRTSGTHSLMKIRYSGQANADKKRDLHEAEVREDIAKCETALLRASR